MIRKIKKEEIAELIQKVDELGRYLTNHPEVSGEEKESCEYITQFLKKEGYEEFLKGSGETATYFIRSLATGDISDEMVNVINNGYIDNVSSGIIVELPTYIDEFGLHPQKIGKLPDAIAAQCDRLGREYLLMVEAAATCNYELARQAMFLDPLVSNCKYPELLLKDLIRANLDLLPEAWEKHC